MHHFPLNQLIPAGSDDFIAIHKIVTENAPLIAKLSSTYLEQTEIRNILSQITQSEIDESLHINLPFYCDFGRHIRIGKEVFINTACVFTDLGGIVIEDKVLIAPNVKIISVNHDINPQTRRGLILSPVHIKKNAWIGAGATILPGVTIGENSIIAAGAVVNKNVPDNTIYGGIPAKLLKNI
ncbi:MAG: maltose O-acetyltransferase [Neisseriaceae bacterium]|nr:maltose O-acetyltransferase [Neisseriaceae bacterium]